MVMWVKTDGFDHVQGGYGYGTRNDEGKVIQKIVTALTKINLLGIKAKLL